LPKITVINQTFAFAGASKKGRYIHWQP
jgi:hypothetical protein